MFQRKYSIKSGYQIRRENAPYADVQPTGTIYQPYVYDLAAFLSARSGLDYIIDIGAGNGEKLQKFIGKANIMAIEGYEPNIKTLKKNLPDAQIITYDLENGLPPIDEDILKRAIVISSDVIEHIVEPHKYLKSLAHMAKIAPYILISTPDRTRARGPDNFGPPDNPFHVREWSIDELYSLFKRYGMDCVIGYTVSNDDNNFKGTSLAITGTQALPQQHLGELQKVLAVVTTYNEEDIISQTIQHLLRQGIDVHVIDNWSTDNTLREVKKLARKHDNVTYEQFPTKRPEKHVYEWKKLLERVEEIARNSSHDWVMHNDADELRVAPWRKYTLQQAFTFADKMGYNAVDFTVADFRPVKDGYDGKVSPDEFFHNFEFAKLAGHFVQIRGWRNIGPVELTTSGGHIAVFEGQKIFPIKFINKHYPLRSVKQAKTKVKTRKSQFSKAERRIGWHIQYDNVAETDPFLWDEAELNKYTPEYFYVEYMVELMSGIGIAPNEVD